DPLFQSKVVARLLIYFYEKKPTENVEQNLASTLRSLYLSKNTLPGLLGGVSLITESYSELVILEKGEQKQEKDSFKDGRLSSWEEIHGGKRPISLGELFEGKAVKRLLLLGRAGVGKSTLCQFIAHSWASGKLWNSQFEAVIWVPLRAIRNFNGGD